LSWGLQQRAVLPDGWARGEEMRIVIRHDRQACGAMDRLQDVGSSDLRIGSGGGPRFFALADRVRRGIPPAGRLRSHRYLALQRRVAGACRSIFLIASHWTEPGRQPNASRRTGALLRGADPDSGAAVQGQLAQLTPIDPERDQSVSVGG